MVICGHGTAHHGAEFALLFIKYKELLGECGLIAEHVDQETQRAKVVAEFVKGAGSARTVFVNLGFQQLFDAIAHAQHGLRSLIQAQHREHAAHLGELAGHLGQHRTVLRVAEKLVE